MRAFNQLFITSLREWSRDPTAMMWTLVFPVMITLFLGIVFASEKLTFRIGVVNQDGIAGEALVSRFDAHPAFDVTTGSHAREMDALRDGKRRAVVVIPAGAAQAPDAAQVPVAVYYDPGHQNAPLILSAVQDVIAGMNAQITGVSPPLVMQPQTFSADEFRRIDYMLPGILSMGLMQLGLFATAPLLVSLRERHVLRRMSVTPLRRTTLLAAQIAFRLIIAVLQMAVLVIIGILMYGMRVNLAHLPGIIGFTMLGGSVFVALSYLLAAFARTEEAVQGLVGLPNLLFMMLSGIFFPVENMPGWARPLVDAVPLTYLADALRQLIVDAPPLYSLPTDAAVLIAWLVICGALAVRYFRWEPQA